MCGRIRWPNRHQISLICTLHWARAQIVRPSRTAVTCAPWRPGLRPLKQRVSLSADRFLQLGELADVALRNQTVTRSASGASAAVFVSSGIVIGRSNRLSLAGAVA